jgi:hypothetical protein
MKSIFISSLVLLCFAPVSPAQPPDTLWTRSYGGLHARAYSAIQVEDGFVATGYRIADEMMSEAVWILKTDVYGDTLWTTTYDFSHLDRAYCIRQTDDGGFIVAGETESFGDLGDPDAFIMKTDENGDSLWFRVWGGDDIDVVFEAQQTSDGGYIAVGNTHSFGSLSINGYLIKTDADGNEMWTVTYGNPGQGTVETRSVQQTTDGGYAIVGYTFLFGTSDYHDVYLIKTDSNGFIQWEQAYGDDYDEQEEGESVRQTSDGGYIMTGYRRVSYADWDVWLLKTDALGGLEWSRTYGDDLDEWGCCVRQTTDGGYVVAGEKEMPASHDSDCYVIKTDENGDTLWTFTLGGFLDEIAYEIEETDDEGYIIAGKTESFVPSGYENCYLIRLGGELPYVESPHLPIPGQIILYPAFPNPFNPTTVIGYQLPMASPVKLSIYDISGHLIALLIDKPRRPGYHEVAFDGTALSTGLYIYHFKTREFTGSGKMILMK